MAETIAIPERFNGPPGSANGGYACGVLAGLLGASAAEVALRAPPPLGRPLEVVRAGGSVELRDGGTLVAEGRAAELRLETPEPIPPTAASEASRAGRARWAENHPFPTCVVCGPERRAGDGLRLFPGPLARPPGAHAAAWTPDPGLAGESGRVPGGLVWAALDCPTSAPVTDFGSGPPLVLARLHARVERPVVAGREHVILSWPLGAEGRKRHAAAALFDARGAPVAASRALWIELRS